MSDDRPDPKRIVSQGYDRCGPAYNAARAAEPVPELATFVEVLPPHARVLDIGCGGGVPVAATLVRHASVVGVDLSAVQVEQARGRVPEATFIHGDILDQSFEPGSFDGAVMLYTLFHLPREQHRTLLEHVARWLRPGGHLLTSVAASESPGYTEDDFFGATIYWSHFEPGWYEGALGDLGFTVIHKGVLGHGYGSDEQRPPERHPVILARLDQHEAG